MNEYKPRVLWMSYLYGDRLKLYRSNKHPV